jgi:hypothetical protein
VCTGVTAALDAMHAWKQGDAERLLLQLLHIFLEQPAVPRSCMAALPLTAPSMPGIAGMVAEAVFAPIRIMPRFLGQPPAKSSVESPAGDLAIALLLLLLHQGPTDISAHPHSFKLSFAVCCPSLLNGTCRGHTSQSAE